MESNNPLLSRDSAFDLPGTERMTISGTINKIGFLTLLCIIGAGFGWDCTSLRGGLIIVPALVAFAICLVAIFKPETSPLLAPVYALLEGLVVGAVSAMYNLRYPGIVFNAALSTFAVLGVMAALFQLRIVRVTPSLWRYVTIATCAIAVTYLVDIGLRFFGMQVPLLNSNGWLGIGVSVAICLVAAFNLLLDFDLIEQRTNSGAPKFMEWYCALSLLVTIVWLYFEIIRLLAKLKSRD